VPALALRRPWWGEFWTDTAAVSVSWAFLVGRRVPAHMGWSCVGADRASGAAAASIATAAAAAAAATATATNIHFG
jgi:hypothetical protein